MGSGIDGLIELLWALSRLGVYFALNVVGGCGSAPGSTCVQLMSRCIPSTRVGEPQGAWTGFAIGVARCCSMIEVIRATATE